MSEAENFTNISRQRGCEKQKFHADFTLLGDGAEKKKSHVRDFSARNAGAGNGCANLVGTWDVWALSAGKTPCP